jgi:hypothetical protein
MNTRSVVATTIVTALALTLAACTTELTSDPGPTLTSTTSTTTSTTVPASTTTSTTVAETTTTAAVTTTLPAGPVDAVVPLLIGGADGGWLNLGEWQFDGWSDAVDAAGDPIAPSVGPGTGVTVSNLATEAAGQLGDTTEACSDGRIGPTMDMAVPAPEPPGFGYAAIALPTPTWALKPRPVAVTNTGPDTYKALGQAAFTGAAVDASLGAVQQLVVTDLDADGDDEALMIYEYIKPGTVRGAAGDLSSVLLVDAASRTSSTVERSFVAPADRIPSLERFRILDVADLNGDGRMEVAVHAWKFEGAVVQLYEYDGTKLTQVLTAGCGA